MPKADVAVQVLDGHSTIGGTKILVGWEGEGAFLDFGMNYAQFGRYFEEYLKPRSVMGIGDLWHLGIVPKIRGLYRGDVTPSDLPGGENLPIKQVNGVFVSHAHLDHVGLAGLLNRNVPLVTSSMTAAILKATQDSGKSELWTSPCYSADYDRTDEGRHLIYKASASRVPHQGRSLLVTDNASPAFGRFWQTLPWLEGTNGNSRRMTPGEVAPYRGDTGLMAKAHVVDHSVLGGSAFVLESPNGPIVYTGDLRAHGKQAHETRSFLESLIHRRPYILMMEGTQVRPRGERDHAMHEPKTEEGVKQACHEAVEDFRGKLVLADFAPRNVERLLAFWEIAHKTRRRLVVFPKDAYLLYAMHQADPTIPLPGRDIGIYDPPSGTEAKWETWLLDTMFPDGHVSAAEIRRAPGEFLLCFSFYDLKHLLDFAPEGGAYIYSNSEAHSEEQEIDFVRLRNWLEFFGLKVLGFQFKDDPRRPGKRYVDPVGAYHCSGHMPGEEVLDWIVRIHPENLVPVHTTYADGFAEAVRQLTDVRVHLNGMIR